jgi:hypothetical protein
MIECSARVCTGIFSADVVAQIGRVRQLPYRMGLSDPTV